MKRIINTAIVYFIFAMAGGVFYREFTKWKGQMTDPEWIQASSREGASRTMETCSETELQLFG